MSHINIMYRHLLLFMLLLSCVATYGQRQTEYNEKGDEAMLRADYRDAKMWYEEGVSYCDPYSITRLTDIWQLDSSMHVSMGPVMNKCLSCLNNSAMSRDSLAIKRLMLFYTEGIGTARNEVFANYWKEQLQQLRLPSYVPVPAIKKPRERMPMMLGYSFSPTAPYGLQVSGLGKLGWYVRGRTDVTFNFGNTPTSERGRKLGSLYEGRIPSLDEKGQTYRFIGGSDGVRSSLYGVSLGMQIRVTPKLYLSFGGGYVRHEVSHAYEEIDRNTLGVLSGGWVRDADASYRGLSLELDGTYRLGKHLYISGGCQVWNLRDFEVTPVLGLGVVIGKGVKR
jgi:hypothetical protein